MYLVSYSNRTKGLKVPNPSVTVSHFLCTLGTSLCPVQMGTLWVVSRFLKSKF